MNVLQRKRMIRQDPEMTDFDRNSNSRIVYNGLNYHTEPAGQDDVPQIWPGWTIARTIGRGSYGKVYEIHRRNGSWLEKAAMKLIRIPESPTELDQLRMDGLGDRGTEEYLAHHVEEIRTEIGLMQRFVGNSNIVSYEDYMIRKHPNEIGWDILIRMELLETLPDYMNRHSFFESDVIRLGVDICQALIICHQAGIIHRDIKPQNIFVNEHGFFKLGDFGISRPQPAAGSVMSFKGTLAFMAPETYAMRGTDVRSDIYSLGLVLYRILNGGKDPFLDATTGLSPEIRDAAQRRRLMGEPVPAPAWGSAELKHVIATALAPDPSARFQTAVQFQQALRAAAAAVKTSPDQYRQKWSGDSGRHINPFGKNVERKTDNVFQSRRSPGSYKGADSAQKRMIAGILLGASALLLLFGAWTLFAESKDHEVKSAEVIETPQQIQDPAETDTAKSVMKDDKKEERGGKSASASHQNPEPIQESPADDSEGEDWNEDSSDKDPETGNKVEDTGGPSGSPPLVASGSVEVMDEMDRPVQFTDPALEAAVKKDLQYPTDHKITKREAQEVDILKLSGKGKSDEELISNLTGLEAFTELREIELDNNKITDISPVSSLTGLQVLHMENNYIEDISPVTDLNELRKLDLCHNVISNISAVAGLKNLEMLDIRENIVYDITPMAGLTSMKELYLSDNRISEIGPVREMYDLEYLSMNNNPVDDLSPAAGKDYLKTLCLSGCEQIRDDDMRVLESLPALSYLDIRGCSVSPDNSIVKRLKSKDGTTVKR